MYKFPPKMLANTLSNNRVMQNMPAMQRQNPLGATPPMSQGAVQMSAFDPNRMRRPDGSPDQRMDFKKMFPNAPSGYAGGGQLQANQMQEPIPDQGSVSPAANLQIQQTPPTMTQNQAMEQGFGTQPQPGLGGGGMGIGMDPAIRARVAQYGMAGLNPNNQPSANAAPQSKNPFMGKGGQQLPPP
jgi:hypothetical protein